MDVTPTIDANGENITLDLHPTVVELVSLESVDLGASGTIRVPKYVRRSADTTVSVVDGGTVVLGGLMKRTKSKEVRKVPFLGDIPLIKNLFRSETTYEKKSNLIIFITAKILS
jgi:general secretion pathway protein D